MTPRLVVFGAGAVGGVIGARLFEHGSDVVLVARGEHRATIEREGLRLVDPDGTRTLAIPVAGTAAELELSGSEVVLLAIKSGDTAAALDALGAAAPPGQPIVCAQNGVENERLALRRFANVYSMVVQMPATHLEPGVVAIHSAPVSGILDLGRYPAGSDALAGEVAATLEASGFASTARPEIAPWKYAKLLRNLSNAVPVLFGLDSEAEAEDLVAAAEAEGEAALAAAGIGWTPKEEYLERHRRYVTRRPVPGYERIGGSSWQSVRRGRSNVESDYLNGEVSLLGRLHGVATPVNDLLCRLCGAVARGERPAASLTVGEVSRVLDGGR